MVSYGMVFMASLRWVWNILIGCALRKLPAQGVRGGAGRAHTRRVSGHEVAEGLQRQSSARARPATPQAARPAHVSHTARIYRGASSRTRSRFHDAIEALRVPIHLSYVVDGSRCVT